MRSNKTLEQLYTELVGGGIDRMIEQIESVRASKKFVVDNCRFPGCTKGKTSAICSADSALNNQIEALYAQALNLKEQFDKAE